LIVETNLSYRERFACRRVAENYLFRPPYSPEVFSTLLGLISLSSRTVLDVGCGPGKIALGLVNHVKRVDAIDASIEMLNVAKRLSGAATSKIRWIDATMEQAPLDPPYGLIVAGLSIHWMDLDRVLTRFAEAVVNGACLALLGPDFPVDAPWEADETAFMVDFLAKRSIVDGRSSGKTVAQRLVEPILVHPDYRPIGHKVTEPIQFSQSIADYLRGQHSRPSWSEDHLGEKASREFDSEMTKLLTRYAVDGMLTFAVQTRIEWGHVGSGESCDAEARDTRIRRSRNNFLASETAEGRES